MTRNEKAKIISALSEEFKSSDAIIVCDYKGLNVSKLETLRILARQNNVKVQVAKNTLASIALKDANLPNIKLKDTNIFIWGEDQIGACKVVDKFAKDNEQFVLKGAIVGGEEVSKEQVSALAKLPSRDELIAMLLQVWKAPISNFTIGLDALRAKKEAEA